MTQFMPYSPGAIPTQPAPAEGTWIVIMVQGLPPHKDMARSIRNITHPRYPSFVALREAAIATMKGRAPYRGAIGLTLQIRAPGLTPDHGLNDYLGGVMDTLDGSHGRTFTYLPIAYEDDCQVKRARTELIDDSSERYSLQVDFLSND